ncbi:MAG: nucleotide exchange factor GrpE [Phycisphaerae bacterium]
MSDAAEQPPRPPSDVPTDVAVDAGGDEPATLRKERDELQSRNLRLMADMRNLQARLTREKEDALRFAEAEFAKELLVVIDDLERTIDSAKSGAGAEALAEGVRIIYEHFMKVLRTRRVEPIEAVGQPFDPGLHEALLQQPSADVPAGDVLTEVARGYRMHDRVLRASRVVVSSGKPEA